MCQDPIAIRAITFLVALVVCARHRNPWTDLPRLFGVSVDGMASEQELIAALDAYVPESHPAKSAAVDTVRWVFANDRKRGRLFHDDPWLIWREFDNSAFCDLARMFVSHLNAHCFAKMLNECSVSYDPPSLHQFAWETSLITRAFSARWFNACARYQMPEQGSITWYLGHCCGKVQLELARETSAWEEPAGNPWRRRKIIMPALQM
jgi:hypothetical protein